TQPIRAVGGNWVRPERITLNALGRRDGWTEIQERVHVDLVEEDSKAPTDDQVALLRGLVGEAEAGSKIVAVRRENRTWDLQSLGGSENRDVVPVTGQRSKVFVTQAEIQIQFSGRLPSILEIQVVGVHRDEPFWIAHGDRGGGHVPGKEVGQSSRVRIQ